MINKKYNKKVGIGLLAFFYFSCWSWIFFTDGISLTKNPKLALGLAVFASTVIILISVKSVLIFWKIVKKVFDVYSTILAVAFALPLFALMDFLISWLTAIVWIGPEGSFDSVLPLSSPAVLVMWTPLRFAARLIGMFGLAAFVWMCLFLLINKQYRKTIWIPIAVVSVLTFLGWAIYRNPNGTTSQATIISESLSQRVEPINNTQSKFVLFPEFGFDNISEDNLSTRIKAESTTNFIASKRVTNDNDKKEHRNILLFGNTKDGIVKEQDKNRLIPGGEDLSYIGYGLLPLIGQRGTIDYFLSSRSFIKGSKPLEPFMIDNNTVVGAAVCSSIISPRDYRLLSKSGASILSNSASLDIFLGSPVFKLQQKSLAKFMAVSNSRYLLQSANDATAYVIDNNGNQTAETSGINIKEVAYTNNTKKTIYTYIGEWMVIVGSGLLIYLLIQRHKNNFWSKKVNK